MKKLVLLFALSAFSLPHGSNLLQGDCHAAGGTCTGSGSCTACSNCKYCKHCSEKGGSCGVCR